MHSALIIQTVSTFSMTSYSIKQSNAGTIHTHENSDFTFEAADLVYISHLKFLGCKLRSDSVLITVTESNLKLLECSFEDNNYMRGMISATQSNITLAQSIFRDNSADFRIYFSVLLFRYCNVMIVNSIFIDNVSTLMEVTVDETVTTTARDSSALTLIGCEFRNNYNDLLGAAIINVENSDVSIIKTKSINNTAEYYLFAFKSVINIDRSTFSHNHGSAIYLKKCTADILNSVYNSNQGVRRLSGGALTSRDATIRIHSSEFKNNIAHTSSGAIYCLSEDVIIFSGICILANNRTDMGGALGLQLDVQCFVAKGATMIIANNTASNKGGGLDLYYYSKLILCSLQILENRATQNGGGIYVSQFSSIILDLKSLSDESHTSNAIIHFHKNEARNGGGLYLGLNSTVCVYMCHKNAISFNENSADYGGAIYVDLTLPY